MTTTRSPFEEQPTITMKEVSYSLAHKMPFRWGSSTAIYDGGDYVLTSYSTVIARVSPDNEVVYFDNSYYSNTTKRFQNLVSDAFLRNK